MDALTAIFADMVRDMVQDLILKVVLVRPAFGKFSKSAVFPFLAITANTAPPQATSGSPLFEGVKIKNVRSFGAFDYSVRYPVRIAENE